jgi:hypothetical protein
MCWHNYKLRVLPIVTFIVQSRSLPLYVWNTIILLQNIGDLVRYPKKKSDLNLWLCSDDAVHDLANLFFPIPKL